MRCQTYAPDRLYLTTNASLAPHPLKCAQTSPPPKSALLKNVPVTATLPSASMATPPASVCVEPCMLRDQRCVPSAAYFARKTSVRTGSPVSKTAPPNAARPAKVPASAMSPLVPTASASPARLSVPVPPNRFDHRWVPSGAYLARNTSLSPALVSVAPPAFMLSAKTPATTTFPAASTAIALTRSLLAEPPSRFDQTGAPAGVYFATKPSSPPLLCSTPPPKSTSR